jgi:catechol 2,3-dioxygenase-like lactoylglutathione lyase family enzyme
MSILALHHVQLAMPPEKEDEARHFYADLLGLTEVDKPPHLAARGGAWFEHGTARVHLGVEHDFRPARKAHPAFLVEDLEKLLGRCRESGVTIVRDQPLPGYDRAYIYDPFGNRIELMEASAPDEKS